MSKNTISEDPIVEDRKVEEARREMVDRAGRIFFRLFDRQRLPEVELSDHRTVRFARLPLGGEEGKFLFTAKYRQDWKQNAVVGYPTGEGEQTETWFIYDPWQGKLLLANYDLIGENELLERGRGPEIPSFRESRTRNILDRRLALPEASLAQAELLNRQLDVAQKIPDAA